ncbi:MAG: hypothetical protein R3F65_01130 [bacterium]
MASSKGRLGGRRAALRLVVAHGEVEAEADEEREDQDRDDEHPAFAARSVIDTDPAVARAGDELVFSGWVGHVERLSAVSVTAVARLDEGGSRVVTGQRNPIGSTQRRGNLP